MSVSLLDKLKEICGNLGISLKTLADWLDIPEATIVKAIKGDKEAENFVISKICSTFELNSSYFYSKQNVNFFIPKNKFEDLIKNNVGGRVRTKRIEKGYTQKQLSELTGINQSYLSEIEKGRRILSVSNAEIIGDALETGSEWLLTGNTRNKESPLNQRLIDFLLNHVEAREICYSLMMAENMENKEETVNQQEENYGRQIQTDCNK